MAGLGTAQTMIRATANGAQSDPVSITVVSDESQAAAMIIDPMEATLQSSETVQLNATVWNINGDLLPDAEVT